MCLQKWARDDRRTHFETLILGNAHLLAPEGAKDVHFPSFFDYLLAAGAANKSGFGAVGRVWNLDFQAVIKLDAGAASP